MAEEREFGWDDEIENDNEFQILPNGDYNFTVTEELVPALERLEGLAVNKYRMDDYSCQDCFKEVWNSVQHEVDLYEEGEESPLNKNSCRGAKNWLNSFRHLC